MDSRRQIFDELFDLYKSKFKNLLHDEHELECKYDDRQNIVFEIHNGKSLFATISEFIMFHI